MITKTKIIIATLIAIIAGAAIFFVACKKENETTDKENNSPILKSQGYYDQLSAETNVDIFKLASSPELRQYLDETFAMAEEFTEIFREKTYSEEDMARIEELMSLMSSALDNDDWELFDIYYKKLCALLRFRPWLLEEEAATVFYNKAIILQQYIEKEHPSFFRLDNDKQNEIMLALGEIIENEEPTKADPCSRCWSTYKREVRNASILAAIDMGGCALLGPGAPVCAAAVATSYACSVYLSYTGYAACYKSNGCK